MPASGYQYLTQSIDGGVIGRRYSYGNEGKDGIVTFNSMGGTDMRVWFGSREVGTLQAITVGIQREKSPIYTNLGTGPRGFTRGKRAISGTMTFAQFDRHALLYGPFYDRLNDGDLFKLSSKTDRMAPNLSMYGAADVGAVDMKTMFGRQKRLQYADQLPPFDVVITFANESGASAVLKIVGVEILTEGYGFTMDDMSQDMACAYACREVMPLAPVTDVNKDFGISFMRHEASGANGASAGAGTGAGALPLLR